jgi:hypothetical protein
MNEPVFLRGDVVVAACGIGSVTTGTVGNVIGKPDPKDGRLPVRFDGVDVTLWCAPNYLGRPSANPSPYVIIATTADDMRVELVEHLQRLLVSARHHYVSARTQKEGRYYEARGALLVELLAIYRGARLEPKEPDADDKADWPGEIVL